MHRPVITPYLLTINFLCKKKIEISSNKSENLFLHTLKKLQPGWKQKTKA